MATGVEWSDKGLTYLTSIMPSFAKVENLDIFFENIDTQLPENQFAIFISHLSGFVNLKKLNFGFDTSKQYSAFQISNKIGFYMG